MSMSRTTRLLTLATAVLVVVVASLALAACGELAEEQIEREMEQALAAEGKEADVDIDGESGSITVSGDEGDASMTFGEAATVPEGFPQDLLPDGAEILSAIDVSEGSATMQSVSFKSDESPEQLYQWFLDALPKAGYQVEDKMEFDSGGSTGFNIAASGATDDCNVSGAGDEGEFVYTVAIIPK